MLSLGIKYRTQSKVKLALSGLLNPREGVIWLFCSSTCASHRCHTSNYKLIGLKMQKRLHLIFFQILHSQKKRKEEIKLTALVGQNHHLIFICFSFSCGLLLDPGLQCMHLYIYMYMISFLLKPDTRNEAQIVNCEIQSGYEGIY